MNFSSQLKHRPRSRRLASSAGVKRLKGRGGCLGKMGNNGRVGGEGEGGGEIVGFDGGGGGGGL